MRNVAGSKMAKHEVPCRFNCGRTVVRAVHFKDARCHVCARKRQTQRYGSYQKQIRDQARRYRIILCVLGWDDSQFEEMVEEMKRSPMMFRTSPENEMDWRDWQKERRRKPAKALQGVA